MGINSLMRKRVWEFAIRAYCKLNVLKFPPIGWVRFGGLRRLEPISRYSASRGIAVVRYYIYEFLAQYSEDISGSVLEIEDDICTKKFGGNRVLKSDVLHVWPDNPKATIVADLTKSSSDIIPSNSFDCIIFTHTLQHIYDAKAAIRTLYRILKPGGVLLVTNNGINRISRGNMDKWGEYWHFTSLSLRLLFEEVFLPENVEVQTYGNVLAAICVMHGISARELKSSELNYHDRDFEVVIGLRARKNGS
jgi:SAM-dependent methyltransferase